VFTIVTAVFSGTLSAVSRYARSSLRDNLPSSSSGETDTPTVRQIAGLAASHATPDSRPLSRVGIAKRPNRKKVALADSAAKPSRMQSPYPVMSREPSGFFN
jgi:hypothetical protein